MMVRVTITLLALITVFSCKENVYDGNAKSYLYKIMTIHKGRGYYELKVFYRFTFEDNYYESDFNYDLGRIYNVSPFEEGDSLLIKFDKNDPKKSKFLKISYDKSFFEKVKKVKDLE